MKYNIKAKVFSCVFTKLLKEYSQKHNMEIKPYIKAIKKEYKEIIKRTPGLAKGNILQDNLVGASYFFAIAKKVPGMNPELMDEIVEESMSSPFMTKMYKKCRTKGLLFSDKKQDKMVELAKKSQSSNYEMDWKFSYEKKKDEFYLTYTKCGVCKLAKQENVLEYLPSMCKMDFTKYRIKGALLERDKTLVNGDDCCNFHVTKIKN